MTTIAVQRNMPSEGGRNKMSEALIRCPHCDQHFYHGGEVQSPIRNPEDMRREFRKDAEESMADHEAGDRRPIRQLREDPLAMGRIRREEPQPKRMAHGGRVDGAGLTDGIHSHPAECAHLAAGGVCRHTANGSHDSFSGYLVKRRIARAGGR